MTFAHFTLATRDVQKSSDFFEKVFGWKPLKRPGNIDGKAAWLSIADEQEIHLLEVPEFEPSPFEREYGRHIALFHPLEGFPALKERLVENGAELIDALRPTPFQRFFFREPNGYIFEVIDAENHSEQL